MKPGEVEAGRNETREVRVRVMLGNASLEVGRHLFGKGVSQLGSLPLQRCELLLALVRVSHGGSEKQTVRAVRTRKTTVRGGEGDEVRYLVSLPSPSLLFVS